jgi:hypothetical protein
MCPARAMSCSRSPRASASSFERTRRLAIDQRHPTARRGRAVYRPATIDAAGHTVYSCIYAAEGTSGLPGGEGVLRHRR